MIVSINLNVLLYLFKTDSDPTRLAVDSAGRYVFYSDHANKQILRMGVDGKKHIVFINEQNYPFAVAVDYQNG